MERFYRLIIKPKAQREKKRVGSNALRRLFYAQTLHGQFALLAFFMDPSKGAEADREFLREHLQIEGLDSVLFALRQPPWHTKGGDPRFWNAEGEVRDFLSLLFDSATVPMRMPRRISVDLTKNPSVESLYLFLPEAAALERVYREHYGNQYAFFTALESTHISKLLGEVRTRVKINSLPLQLDRENPNLGRYSATRRVARTIYLGSAPTQRAAHKGIEDRQVKLGCVQPGESVATFGDALRRLTDRATYLYVDGKRYWYSTQPTVTRLAEDRAAQLDPHTVADEIQKRLREQSRSRGDFAKVHPCPASGADIPDEQETRLVILGPDHAHAAKSDDSAARKGAAAILDLRGTSPRNYKNTLVFLAPDATRLKELEQATRQYLAWTSMWDGRESLEIGPFQLRQAETKRKSADDTVEARIPETFHWLLVPGQSDPKGEMEWSEIRLQGQDGLAARAAKKMKNEEMLMVQLGGTRLRHELDRVPLWRGTDQHQVGVKQLAEDFAKYLYLPRLRDADVLLAAIRDGVERLTWKSETFGYAEGWDETKKRYKGLQGGQSIRVLLDGQSVLVKAEVAEAQIDAENAMTNEAAGNGGSVIVGGGAGGTGEPGSGSNVLQPGGRSSGSGSVTPVAPEQAKLRRFHGMIRLDATRLGRDASKIADEVVTHLNGLLDTSVEVTLEIQADIPDRAPEKVVRDVTENCRTLRFESHGFEESMNCQPGERPLDQDAWMILAHNSSLLGSNLIVARQNQ